MKKREEEMSERKRISWTIVLAIVSIAVAQILYISFCSGESELIDEIVLTKDEMHRVAETNYYLEVKEIKLRELTSGHKSGTAVIALYRNVSGEYNQVGQRMISLGDSVKISDLKISLKSIDPKEEYVNVAVYKA